MIAVRSLRLVNIFTVVIAASVAVALALFLWRLADLFAAPSVSPQAPVLHQPVDIGPAIAFAPFGQVDGASAQPTMLALQLRGVIQANRAGASAALIAPPGGVPFAYGVGQAVPGGATIEAIAFDRILLRVNGRLERLDLPRPSGTSAQPANGPPPAPSGTAVPTTGPSDAAPPPQIFVPAAAGSLLDILGASPSGAGYRVGDQPPAAARLAGLQPGDVVDRINGQPASTAAADRQLIASAMAAGTARLDVVRAGKRISLSIPLP